MPVQPVSVAARKYPSLGVARKVFGDSADGELVVDYGSKVKELTRVSSEVRNDSMLWRLEPEFDTLTVSFAVDPQPLAVVNIINLQ
jgi:hypothetical protein